MISFWQFRAISEFNSFIFFKRNVILLVLSSIFELITNFFMINALGNQELKESFAAGFSGMIYAWRVFIDGYHTFSFGNIAM
jgi:hypothetical protein